MAEAFTMRIGKQEEELATKQQPRELTGAYPVVLVLSALISKNGSTIWKPVAAALTQEDLDRAAGEWIGKFQDIWLNKMRTDQVPLVIETE